MWKAVTVGRAQALVTHIGTAPCDPFHNEILRSWTHCLINHNNFSCIRANIPSFTLLNHSGKSNQWADAMGQALYQALQRVRVTPCMSAFIQLIVWQVGAGRRPERGPAGGYQGVVWGDREGTSSVLVSRIYGLADNLGFRGEGGEKWGLLLRDLETE